MGSERTRKWGGWALTRMKLRGLEAGGLPLPSSLEQPCPENPQKWGLRLGLSEVVVRGRSQEGSMGIGSELGGPDDGDKDG